MRWGQFLGGAVIGLLLGLAYCYWKAINAAYQNRDVIGKGVALAGAAQDFYGALQQKV